MIQQFKLQQADIETKEKHFIKICNETKELLESLDKFRIYKKIKEDGVFFGKITKKQIMELLNDKVKLSVEINKNQLELPEMKQLGNYVIEVILTSTIIARMSIEILAE